MNRRAFTRQLGGAAAMALPAAGPAVGASGKVHIAIAGMRGRGKDHVRHFSQVPGVSIDTICDIDERLWPGAAELVERTTGRKPKFESDLRRVLEDKHIDAVALALPNHWHALATIWACQAGKDVYVEKPASYSIQEGRKMVEAARKYNRVVATGTQHRSAKAVRQAMEFLHSGKLGKLYMVRCPVFRPREKLAFTPATPVPEGVHYDMWLGPAPWRSFQTGRFHYNWHWFWDTGNGETGNNGPHYADLARWGLQKREHPRKAFSAGGLDGFDSFQETPNTQFSMLEYADGVRIQMEVRGLYTNAELNMRMGLIFYGSEGWLRMNTSSWEAFFGRKNEPGPRFDAGGEAPVPEPHFANFIDCVRSRKADHLASGVLEGHLSAAICHLGNIAYRTGRTLTFDSATETFPGDPEASGYLGRPGRVPYRIPDPV